MHVPEVLVANHDFRHTFADGRLGRMAPMRVDGRFNIAGFAGWLACMVPSGVDLYEGRLSGWPAGVWSAAFLTFGAAYAGYLWRPAGRRRSTIDILLVSAQTGAGVAMVWAAYGMTKYLCGITLVVVAGELPYVFSRQVVWIWVAAQSTVLTAIFWNSFSWLAAVSGGGAFAASHVFNVGQSFLGRASRRRASSSAGRTPSCRSRRNYWRRTAGLASGSVFRATSTILSGII